ncbi:MAG: MFS transporter [Firmicutes bacterium]|nr:MFS transporter [Bacillota bacterium]
MEEQTKLDMSARLTKKERSWVMYDWANSAFATIMMAAVFNAFFTGLVPNQRGDYFWSLGVSVATLIVAVSAPILGSFADYKGFKKKLFAVYLALGLVATALCAISDTWQVLLIAYVFAFVGFSGSCLLYDSFLPDVTTPARMDKVSGWGYAMGYIGGSTIPFVISIVLIQFGGHFGVDKTLAVKLSIWITVIWWGLFTIPFFKNIHQDSFVERPKTGAVRQAFTNIFRTAKKIGAMKGLLFFLLAYFFYIDGVGTVISLATSYGTVLGLTMVGMILALMVTQIVAFPFSILFSRFAKKIGSLNMITVAVGMYVVICVVGFFMGFIIERQEIPAKLAALSAQGITVQNSGNLTAINAALQNAKIEDTAWNLTPAYVSAVHTSQVLFWVLATMVGMVQGGIQALSRSYFGKLVPPANSGEFFGFFEIFSKFAAIIGPALYALVKGITGRSSFSILSIILLFAVGLVLLTVGRKQMKTE